MCVGESRQLRIYEGSEKKASKNTVENRGDPDRKMIYVDCERMGSEMMRANVYGEQNMGANIRIQKDGGRCEMRDDVGMVDNGV